MTTPLVYIGD